MNTWRIMKKNNIKLHIRQLLSLIIVFSIFCFYSSCFANRKIYLSDIILTENSLIIEIDLKNVTIYNIKDVRIDYKNISKAVLFEPEEIMYNKTKSNITINLNLNDKVLYTNEEAEIYIQISGGFIVGHIFIGNPISNIEPYYIFPSQEYESVKIIILNQSYSYRI